MEMVVYFLIIDLIVKIIDSIPYNEKSYCCFHNPIDTG